jgi:hypothetical protein
MLKFVDQWYINYSYRGNSAQFPFDVLEKLGFMTPDGTDQAATKRKATVDNWSSAFELTSDGQYIKDERTGHPKRTKVPGEILKCVALEGFRIHSSISRGGSYYGSQDKWRIFDPRGFELEITSKNIEVILTYTTVINGVIQGKCRWAREGANNVLVPEAAPEFQEATANTKKLATSTFELNDTHIGKLVQTKMPTMEQGIYLGKWNLSKVRNYDFKFAKGYHVFLITGGYRDIYRAVKDPKAISVSDEYHHEVRNMSDVNELFTILRKEGDKPKPCSWDKNRVQYNRFHIEGHNDYYSSWSQGEFFVDKERVAHADLKQHVEMIDGDHENKFIVGFTDENAKVPAIYVTTAAHGALTYKTIGEKGYGYYNQPAPPTNFIYYFVKNIG